MIKTRLLKILKGERRFIVFQCLLEWAGLLVQILISWCIAHIICEVMSPNLYRDVLLERLMRYILYILGGMVVHFGLDHLLAEVSYRSSVNVKQILREQIYSKLLRLGSGYQAEGGVAGITQLMSDGVEQLEAYFGKYLPQLFYTIIAPITLFGVLFLYDRPASIILLICVPLIPLAILCMQRLTRNLQTKYWGQYAALGDGFMDHLQGMTTLKIYQADEVMAQRMDKASENYRRVNMNMLALQLGSSGIMDIIAFLGIAIGFVVTLSEYAAGKVSLEGALMFLLLAMEFFLPLRKLGASFQVAMNGMAASDRMFALLDEPEPESDGKGFPEKYRRIRIDNMGFSYTEDREILKGVSMEMRKGEFISLVGVSGSGKSTIAGILMGRNRGYQGEIYFDGSKDSVSLASLSEKELRKYITYVGAESIIFQGTVRENLLMGKANATEREMMLALHVAGLDTELGLDDRLAEGANDLSGGQRQRLAMARALLHNSSVYIFDEATSNIDVESEDLIMRLVHEIAKRKTVLMISHRLSHAERADRIYFIENGGIAESGTFDELIEADGAFAELYREQKALEQYAWEKEELERRRQEALNAEEEFVIRDMDEEEEDELREEPEESEEPENTGEKYTAKDRRRGKRRSNGKIMAKLFKLLTPMLPAVLLAIIVGIIATVASLAVSVGPAYELALLTEQMEANGAHLPVSFIMAIVIAAVIRGIFHYVEQYCDHYIAHRMLAWIRHKVFAAMRLLCPARLEVLKKGELLAVLTGDIEKLEEFYAHTLSPIVIAVLTGGGALVVFGKIHPVAILVAAGAYLVIGMMIPAWNSKRSGSSGMQYREALAMMNSRVLENLRGLNEVMQYDQGERMLEDIRKRSQKISEYRHQLSRYEGSQMAVTNLLIHCFSLCMVLILGAFCAMGQIGSVAYLTVVFLLIASYAPMESLAVLSNNLAQTMASGERVLALLEEKPVVPEVKGRRKIGFSYGVEAEGIHFSYPGGIQVFDGYSTMLSKGGIIGVHGPSGCGKSTLLKLIMRFWDVEEGAIRISGADVREMNTVELREMMSYVTQEAVLFTGTIRDNIRIGRWDAEDEEIEEAAKKASIHDFIMSLPEGYETQIGERNMLSGGERQRIGLARSFLHNADILLLDEPTSNLDALNEGIILKSIREACTERTVVLVSHRRSTLRVADRILEMK